MPNKHRLRKIQTKLLTSGHLNNKPGVQQALRYIAEKAELDKEDINFNFETGKNSDFERLETHDDNTLTGGRVKQDPRRNNKRKAGPKVNLIEEKIKRQKMFEENGGTTKVIKADNEVARGKKTKKISIKNPPTTNTSKIVPTKSKKNKYFFIAHPEVLAKKKDEILANEKLKEKFVLDDEKMKLNEVKKEKRKMKKLSLKSKEEATKKLSKTESIKKMKKSKIWIIEECSSESESEEVASVANNNAQILDIDNIDKHFRLKKTKQKMSDGGFVEAFMPEILNDNDNVDKETANEEDLLMSDGKRKDNEEEKEEIDEEKSEQKNETVSGPKNEMMEKLTASRFRYLNQLLYTQESSKSFEYFKEDTDAFKAYHEGFRSQVEKWPINPLDTIIKYIKSRPANQVVADFGCGEAKLAKSVKNKVHSFDLIPLCDLVTQCDMKNVPLKNMSVDMAVFCLSLMGTNSVEFLCEAHRILRPKGILKIAEVVSRIPNRGIFVQNIESMGFKLVSNKNIEDISGKDRKKDKRENKDYFYYFDFIKMTNEVKKRPDIKLLPCLYKKR